MLLSKPKARKIKAPTRETVSTDVPPPCPDEPGAPAAAGLDGASGARGALGGGSDAAPDWCTVAAACPWTVERLLCTTTTRVNACASTCRSVVLRTTGPRPSTAARRRVAAGRAVEARLRCGPPVRLGVRAGRAGTASARSRCATAAGSRASSGVGGRGIGGIENGGGGGIAGGCVEAANAVLASVEAATVESTRFDCVTSPLSPGLAIRMETATLHWTQTDETPAAGAGAPPGHSHCQFQIQTVEPGGGAGTGEADAGSQFQLQFQIQTSGGLCESPLVVPFVISGELSSAVLPLVSPAPVAGGPASGAGGGVVGVVAVAGACPADGDAGGGVLPVGAAIVCDAVGEGALDGAPAGEPVDTTGGIAWETGDCCGLDAVAALEAPTGSGAIVTVGTGGRAGAGTTTAGGATGAGMTGTTTPASARAEGAAHAPSASRAATTPAQLAPLPLRRVPRSIHGDMYPPFSALMRKMCRKCLFFCHRGDYDSHCDRCRG